MVVAISNTEKGNQQEEAIVQVLRDLGVSDSDIHSCGASGDRGVDIRWTIGSRNVFIQSKSGPSSSQEAIREAARLKMSQSHPEAFNIGNAALYVASHPISSPKNGDNGWHETSLKELSRYLKEQGWHHPDIDLSFVSQEAYPGTFSKLDKDGEGIRYNVSGRTFVRILDTIFRNGRMSFKELWDENYRHPNLSSANLTDVVKSLETDPASFAKSSSGEITFQLRNGAGHLYAEKGKIRVIDGGHRTVSILLAACGKDSTLTSAVSAEDFVMLAQACATSTHPELLGWLDELDIKIAFKAIDMTADSRAQTYNATKGISRNDLSGYDAFKKLVEQWNAKYPAAPLAVNKGKSEKTDPAVEDVLIRYDSLRNPAAYSQKVAIQAAYGNKDLSETIEAGCTIEEALRLGRELWVLTKNPKWIKGQGVNKRGAILYTVGQLGERKKRNLTLEKYVETHLSQLFSSAEKMWEGYQEENGPEELRKFIAKQNASESSVRREKSYLASKDDFPQYHCWVGMTVRNEKEG